jgi:hypothetical protein
MLKIKKELYVRRQFVRDAPRSSPAANEQKSLWNSIQQIRYFHTYLGKALPIQLVGFGATKEWMGIRFGVHKTRWRMLLDTALIAIWPGRRTARRVSLYRHIEDGRMTHTSI